MKKTVKSLIYARCSNNLGKASLPRQIRKCREFVEAKGWVVIGEYHDKTTNRQKKIRKKE